MTFNSLALENLYISVKTTPKYYESRIHVLKMTWFQLVKKDKVIRLKFYVIASLATTSPEEIFWYSLDSYEI